MSRAARRLMSVAEFFPCEIRRSAEASVHGGISNGIEASRTTCTVDDRRAGELTKIASRSLLERRHLRLGSRQALCADLRHYCWPVESLQNIRVTPFHDFTSWRLKGRSTWTRITCVHTNSVAGFVREDDALLKRTPYHVVDLADSSSEAAATAWWETLTEAGGEGAVVKLM